MNNIQLALFLSKHRDELMGYAAISIFLMHVVCANLFSWGVVDKLFVLWGSSGVDIFLLLSGLGISCSLKKININDRYELFEWIKKRFLEL